MSETRRQPRQRVDGLLADQREALRHASITIRNRSNAVERRALRLPDEHALDQLGQRFAAGTATVEDKALVRSLPAQWVIANVPSCYLLLLVEARRIA